MEGDVIDLLLRLKKEKSTPIDLTLENIKAIIMNMLVGGTDTSAAAVVWAMTALIAKPNAMKKVQAEIQEMVGKMSIKEYEIKPKTIIHVNVWAIARNPEIWENPEEFIPKRFLNSDTDFKGQNFELIPFGAGRRGFPAMALGVATVELVLSNLLYAFDWELPCRMKKEDIDTDVLPGLTMHKKEPLCLVPKNYH
ncbi:hypothetical protein R3W88_025876 [Solanum pinnatisectum]|uniref:Cytochrome P450 n=1 Tax=Solanum pinnatisectum TaxID=50273 RepID=A0AAV9M5B1_9SOLN|nr:hypothetical protein R3W88_025876 [Solanum pinnatisectum]